MRISTRLSMVYLVAIPVLVLTLVCLTPVVFKIFDRVFKTYDKLNNVVQENVRGIRVVKSFVRENRETEKFQEISGSIFKDFCKAEKILAVNNPIMQTCVYACMLTISWVGAQMVVSSGNNPLNGLTTGQLSSMFTYTTQILSSLMMVTMLFVTFSRALASGRRIAEVLDEKIDISDAENPTGKQVTKGSIEFKNVSFRYYKNSDGKVLDDINLTIGAGETVGIIGSTGCGKTTLVSLIARLYDTDEGQVLVDGINVRDYSLHDLREGVGMVLQKNTLFSGSIADNLRWGNHEATMEEIRAAADSAQADGFVMDFTDGYDSNLGQGGTNVSGGQKQRLCIARALLKKPKILILDDSTSAVDTATEARIREAFRTDLADTTKLIIAQRIGSVKDADRIIVMNEGRITGVGTHAELLASNVEYQEIYESQADKKDEEVSGNGKNA